ncbi:MULTISPECIES: hypothetical protein [unclassified Arthrobacter]|uniref:hypothetical protein n=1 Tax=unclassified Arthrobacter TaxID=235627 RepID=UPI001E3AEC05|nr:MULTISPECIES: hypothetical protein [unclassified Arthrobacter]MCC9146375.1 hypothetical protein [Arthrobacter sp. zg-Y919]MDK1277605.1 hypothetical protein [Arthrobacter sp. zg.Y919]WIB02432.1 hypothetical protein QNO10_10740 [Arthrobacter sp. zg-Y919]
MEAEAPLDTVHRAKAAAGRAGAALTRWPWYLQVLSLWAAARLFSCAVLAAAARFQPAGPWWDASPSYWEFINIWDGEWYSRIFADGYPDSVPRDAAGNAVENEWAFYALFPLLVRVLDGTGLGWNVLAPVAATAAGFAAALVIYRLFRLRAGKGTAMWAVLFVAVFPVSPILQVPYAESLNLLLLAGSLYLFVAGRYLTAIPVVALMCLSRPVGVPFALAVGLVLAVRFLRRRQVGFPARQAWRLLALAGAAGVSALAWPVIAWVSTGDLRAYTDTESAWRFGNLVPFKPWLTMTGNLFGPLFGPVALGALLVAVALYLTSEPVRRLGLELQLWCAAYVLYLLVFLNPQTSTFRLLLPLFPLALSTAWLSRSRAYRGTVAAAFAVLQIVWVVWLWRWTELPGGGDYPP